MKKSDVAFVMAAGAVGLALAFIEVGVRLIVAEKADEAWEKVTQPEVTPAS